DAPDPASVRVRIGPLYLNPTIGLTNLGVDDNVFNDPTSAAPKKDFTLTLTPKTDLWLHMGPTWVVGSIKEEINWYQQYASERNRESTQYGVTLREQITTLTSVTFSTQRSRDRFEFSPLRDSDFTSGLVSVSFDPAALINGSASFGYTKFQPADASLQPFNGF